jgi:hypothetical protein
VGEVEANVDDGGHAQKSEILNPKCETNPKSEYSNSKPGGWGIVFLGGAHVARFRVLGS